MSRTDLHSKSPTPKSRTRTLRVKTKSPLNFPFLPMGMTRAQNQPGAQRTAVGRQRLVRMSWSRCVSIFLERRSRQRTVSRRRTRRRRRMGKRAERRVERNRMPRICSTSYSWKRRRLEMLLEIPLLPSWMFFISHPGMHNATPALSSI